MILPDHYRKSFSYWNANQWAHDLAKQYRISLEADDGLDLHHDVLSDLDDQQSDGSGLASPYLKPKFKERLSENAKRRLSADVLYGAIWRIAASSGRALTWNRASSFTLASTSPLR
jgi:hypothetical protein